MYHYLLKSSAGKLAPKGMLTGSIGPVKDQGQQGSCDGHASSSMGERLFRRWKMQPSALFSPAYAYYEIRNIEGTLSQGDCGGQIVTACQVADLNSGANGFGYCPSDLMPYKDSDFSTAPSQQALDAAKANPGGAYHNTSELPSMTLL